MKEQIQIAAKIYECHDSAKLLFKEEYKEKIEWYIKTLKAYGKESNLETLQAVLKLCNTDSVKDNGVAVMMFMAAVVEIEMEIGTEKRVNRKSQLIKKIVKTTIMSETEKTIEINSATLKGDFCNYSYELEVSEHSKDEITRKGSTLVHDDLKGLFKKLHPHLAVICEEIPADDIKDIDSIEDFTPEPFDLKLVEKDKVYHKEGSLEHKVSKFFASSFQVSGTGENEGVTITGTKMLSTGDFVALKSPVVKWESEYAFVNELRVVIDDLKIEVEEYMNGKQKPKLVLPEFDFPEGESLVEEEA